MTGPARMNRELQPKILMGGTGLGGSDQRVIVRLLTWLGSVKLADLAHPSVRRWGVPALCAALGLSSLLDAADGSGEAGLPAVLALVAGFTVPLLWRGGRPLLVFAVTTAVSGVAIAMGVLTGADGARIVALFNVGRFGTPGQLAVAAAVTAVQTLVSVCVFSTDGQLQQAAQAPSQMVVALVIVTSIAALGLASKLVNAYIEALGGHAVRLEVERDQRARLAAAAERARIAREMHDILGHTLAVMVGLAGGAAGLAETSPKRGADTLRIIAESGRGALGELRRLLAVIHDEPVESGDAPLAPQPGLADLDTLLDRVRDAGPTATLHTEGDLTGLAQGLQLAVYRIVQEALTNTLKHSAPDPTIHVAVCADRGLVHVTVEDTGPHRAPRASAQSDGHGLIGMRERAALYQGSITAGPNNRGGWTVHALLDPISPPPATTAKTSETRPV